MPDPNDFEPLPEEKLALWSTFLNWDETYFPTFVGLRLAEVRLDYCRIELDTRAELLQPAGIVHGGVAATMIDTVVVPAIGSGYDERPNFATISMNVEYRAAAMPGETMVAEGWITQRGRSIVFAQAEVRVGKRVVAGGTCVYKVSLPKS